jgi:excisionase family DNA binding protein
MSAEPWVSVEDVARHLGVSHDTVYRWIEAKGLPAHKVGRLWKFKLADVDEWVRTGGASDDGASASTEGTE